MFRPRSSGNCYFSRHISYRRRYHSPVVYHDLVEHCRTVHEYREEEKLVGYDVSYRYNGRDYTVRLPHDPGPSLLVRVDVEPVL